MTTTIQNPLAWPVQPSDLTTLLQIQCEPSMKCHGRAKTTKNQTCRNPIARSEASQVVKLIQQILSVGYFNDLVKRHLQELSTLVLCKRYHRREQSTSKLEAWLTTLPPISNPEPTYPSTSIPRAIISPKRSPVTPKITSTRQTPEPAQTDPSAETSASRPIYNEDLPQTQVSQQSSTSESTSSGQDSPPSSNTRSKTSGSSHPRSPPRNDPTQPRAFEPYGTRKSIRKTNEDIKKKLLAPFSTSETEAKGYVYGYTHPGEKHLAGTADTYVKIGQSKNWAKRMKALENKCKYKPCFRASNQSPCQDREDRAHAASQRAEERVGLPRLSG